MEISYDSEADAAYIRVLSLPVVRTEELSDVCIVDWAAGGQLVGIELLAVFGFAGASLAALVQRSLLNQAQANEILAELRHDLVTA